MDVWTIVCSFVAALSLVQAVLTLHLNPRAPLNRAVAVMAVSYSVWVFLHGLTMAASVDAFETLVRWTSTARLVSMVTPVPVVLLMVGFPTRRIAPVVAVPAILALVELHQVWSGVWLVAGFHPGPWGPVWESPADPFWPTFHQTVHQVVLTGEAVLLLRYWMRNRARRVRQILGQFVAAGLVGNGVYLGLWAAWKGLGFPDVSVLGWLIIIVVYYVLVVRYKHLMDDEPELAGLVFRYLNVRSLLADDQGRVTFVSQELAEALGLTERQIRDHTVFELFREWPGLEAAWAGARESRLPHKGLTGSLGGRKHTLSLVAYQDSYGDLNGVLLIFDPVWDLEAAFERFGISPRERDVAERLVQAQTMTEIADELFISPATVKNHIRKLLEKTGARNRVDLVRSLTSATPPVPPGVLNQTPKIG